MMARDTDTAVTLGSKHKRTERLVLDKTGTPSVTNTAVLFKLFGYCSEKGNLRLKLKKNYQERKAYEVVMVFGHWHED